MPARRAIQHTPQRSTAQAAPETLLRHTRPQREQNITAGPSTGQAGNIFWPGGWALAHAPFGGLQLRRFRYQSLGFLGLLSHLSFDGPQRLFPALHPLLPTPLPVAVGLLPPTPLPLGTGPVGPGAVPATPADRFLLAGCATIPLLRLLGTKCPLAPLQQTAPRSLRATGLLSRSRRRGILSWAHRSPTLPGSSLRVEVMLDSEAF
jgi:hypothetical protein